MARDSARGFSTWPVIMASRREHASRRGRTKGKDEPMVGYIKHHVFVRYRAFDSWAI